MITVETLVGWIGTVCVITGHAFLVNYRTGQNEKQIDDIWKWKNIHEKESIELRTKYQEQLAELKAGQLVNTEQFRQVKEMFEEIKRRLTDLENKAGRN